MSLTTVTKTGTISDCFDDVNDMIGELPSTDSGKGASQVGIEDSGSLYTATNVEAALAEMMTYAAALPTIATDTIWDAAGDTVYGTGANTAAKLAAGAAGALYGMNAGQTAPEYKSVLVDANGQMTNPSQPAFLAKVASSISDVTGDATAYTVLFGTSVFDQNSDYAVGTGIFTAPVTGKYRFSTVLTLQQIAAENTVINLYITTSNRSYYVADALAIAKNRAPMLTTLCDMDAADTAVVILQVTGATKIIGIYGDASTALASWFCGELIC